MLTYLKKIKSCPYCGSRVEEKRKKEDGKREDLVTFHCGYWISAWHGQGYKEKGPCRKRPEIRLIIEDRKVFVQYLITLVDTYNPVDPDFRDKVRQAVRISNWTTERSYFSQFCNQFVKMDAGIPVLEEGKQ